MLVFDLFFILKQQWTIKMSSPFFLFLAWRPSWLEVVITGHTKFGGLIVFAPFLIIIFIIIILILSFREA
jgi:hypothetical protein